MPADATATTPGERPTFRDRFESFLWRAFWSDYTTWRQDRAFAKWKREHPEVSDGGR